MKRTWLIFVFVLIFSTAWARAEQSDFAKQVDLSPLRTVAVQHAQTIKTLDSFARQTLSTITGSRSLDGNDPLFSILDMSMRPAEYRSRNLIKIKNVPLRKDLLRVQSLSSTEQERIVHDGTVSLNFWMQDDVQQLLQELTSNDTRKAEAIGQTNGAAMTLGELLRGEGGFPPVAMIPPATTSEEDHFWHSIDAMAGTVPSWAADIKAAGHTAPPALANYDPKMLTPVVDATAALMAAWRDQNAAGVNMAANGLAAGLMNINPAVYPSAAKRNVEVIYNKLANLTIPGASLYFIAFILFVMATQSGIAGLRLWGLRLFLIAFLVHSAGIGVRWWLVGSIPIKNEFESVMFSAWFGALVGLLLELRSGKSIFGAGASFVGWLSLGAIFVVPYVFQTSIGENIGQVNGVLMSYWLYIHVTTVTASYALIGMGFALSVWWLVKYYLNFNDVSKVEGGRLAGEARGLDIAYSASGAAAVPMNVWATIGRVLFVPIPETRVAKSNTHDDVDVKLRSSLVTLDACNLVVLQMAFWVLGTGIIFGAIWADQSWGRPWGWDPKETFALITWIVYLIVVHIRVVTDDKAFWTAWLSVVGFFVMVFNWVGVNFFLSGLHSYA